jgi:hypothetical protein
MPRRQVDAAVAAAAGKWRGQADAASDASDIADVSDASESDASESDASDSELDDAIDDHELEAVTRLMGFLRGDDG